MGRIKLPGKERNKKIVLIILVIVTIGILSQEALKNINYRKIESKEQNKIIEPMDIEESEINNTTSKDAKISNEDTSLDKENKLYNEVYNLFFSHDYPNAINKANLFIKEFPNSAKGYNIRGIARAYNGDYDGGISDIDKSLSIENNYGYARFNKALTYELYGKMDEALEWYNKALEIEDYEWSYYGIASIYGRRGDVKNTMIYLNKAILIDSAVKESAKTEEDFNPVKNSEEFQKAVYN